MTDNLLLTLRPMTEETFQAFLNYTVPRYAAEKVQSGQWPEERAVERSAADFKYLLPQGLRTPDHTLLDLWSADDYVGFLWYARRPAGQVEVAYVYQVEVFAPFQRRGLGRAAFGRLEARARAEGLGAIELHVFGHNHAARALYEGLGFQPTSLVLRREL